MISFEEALKIVLENAQYLPHESIKLEDSAGRVLASDIYADRDMPPFDKSAVDGYALKREELGNPLRVVENIAAGYVPKNEVISGTCSKIMTGAVIPAGADFVVMVEDTVEVSGFMDLKEKEEKFKKRNNICYKGEDISEGDLLLSRGTVISPAATAILASAGFSVVSVSKVPVVGIFSTGDEIVEPEVTPLPSQIRNSNGWQLRMQALSTCSKVKYYGIVKDSPELLHAAVLKSIEECDITIITGGVSAGDFDYVPGIIKECGFNILFDKVSVQPGKPSTFAVKKADYNENKVIFALPGNPVSSLIQFEMLVKPYIIKSMGGNYLPLKLSLPAGEDFTRKNNERLSFIPVVINPEGTFSPVRYNGSAHIAAMAHADAIAEIPVGVKQILAGEKATIHIFR
ncbi:MAG: molybdopterin molybdotransferase MoeA [Bacteroidales bacterium]|nr:molybdopterin molybdotransferase MoeA [Bacteroidales bacterium]